MELVAIAAVAFIAYLYGTGRLSGIGGVGGSYLGGVPQGPDLSFGQNQPFTPAGAERAYDPTAGYVQQAAQALNAAIPGAGTVLSDIAAPFLAAHTARLKGAIAENQLIPTTVQAFDADLQAIAAAWNAGTITRQQALDYISAMNSNIYSYMKGNATGPGRAWMDQTGKGLASTQPGASWPNLPLPCGKSCTAECCVYYSALNPVLGMFYQWINGGVPGINRNWGFYSAISGTSLTMNVLEVYPPTGQYAQAYGNFSRPQYQITVRA